MQTIQQYQQKENCLLRSQEESKWMLRRSMELWKNYTCIAKLLGKLKEKDAILDGR